MKFGIGQPMRRHEDLRLITGRGCYTDDVILPRMTHAFVLRSPVAHAHIKRIDTAAGHRGLARRLVALLPPRGPVYVSPASPRIARSAARPLSVSA
jgi:CO/xanthine dehydrogenase Mo-binding subunit